MKHVLSRNFFSKAACFFILLFLMINRPSLFCAETAQSPNEDQLDKIADQMKSLSGSLEAMPDPPKLDAVIQLPVVESEPESKMQNDRNVTNNPMD